MSLTEIYKLEWLLRVKLDDLSEVFDVNGNVGNLGSILSDLFVIEHTTSPDTEVISRKLKLVDSTPSHGEVLVKVNDTVMPEPVTNLIMAFNRVCTTEQFCQIMARMFYNHIIYVTIDDVNYAIHRREKFSTSITDYVKGLKHVTVQDVLYDSPGGDYKIALIHTDGLDGLTSYNERYRGKTYNHYIIYGTQVASSRSMELIGDIHSLEEMKKYIKVSKK